MFNKVKTKKVYIKIVEQILDLIKEGRLKSGDKLPPEQVLAEKFGTSRPSVREALSALEILGITESRGGRGNFIKDTPRYPLYEQEVMELEEEESPFELLEARKALEIACALLKRNGGFVCKILEGEDIKKFKSEVSGNFSQVRLFRPEATRKRSREVYLVGQGFGLMPQ